MNHISPPCETFECITNLQQKVPSRFYGLDKELLNLKYK